MPLPRLVNGPIPAIRFSIFLSTGRSATPRPDVRAEAVQLIVQIGYPKEQVEPVLTSIIATDSSYSVVGTAMNALHAYDPELAYQDAQTISKEIPHATGCARCYQRPRNDENPAVAPRINYARSIRTTCPNGREGISSVRQEHLFPSIRRSSIVRYGTLQIMGITACVGRYHSAIRNWE